MHDFFGLFGYLRKLKVIPRNIALETFDHKRTLIIAGEEHRASPYRLEPIEPLP